MAAKLRLKLHTEGAVALLTDSKVQADLVARGSRIAAAAGDGIVVQAERGRDRSVVFVTTATHDARRAEAESRALTRAIDAGR